MDNATAAGTTPSGGTVTSPSSNTVTVSVDQMPGIAITKSASPTTVTAAGQTVTYTFSVHNTGNVDLTLVGVTDIPTAPAGGVTATCQSLSAPTGTCSGPTTSLAPGQIATFTGSYTVTLADLNHGSIVDDATTQGDTPTGGTVTSLPFQHGHGHRDAVTDALHREVGQPDDCHRRRPDDRLHLLSHQFGERHTQRCRGRRRAREPRRQCHGHLYRPDISHRHVLGGDDDARAGSVGHLHGVVHGDTGRRKPRHHSGHGHCRRHFALEHAGDEPLLQHRHGECDPDGHALHRQVGHPNDCHRRRPAGDLHIQRDQHRQPDADLGGGYGLPDYARRRRHRDLSEPYRSDRRLLGGNNHLVAEPDRPLQRHLRRDPGRHQPRFDRRPHDGHGHHPLRRHGDEPLLQHRHGECDPDGHALHRQVGHPNDCHRRRPAGDLHIQRDQHRQPDADLGGGYGLPDYARRRRHRDLSGALPVRPATARGQQPPCCRTRPPSSAAPTS